jgi:hypothetical protein
MDPLQTLIRKSTRDMSRNELTHHVTQLREALRDVLAAEVRAWRDADTWHELLEVMDMCDDYSHRHDVENAQKEVDVSKARLRAKEIE